MYAYIDRKGGPVEPQLSQDDQISFGPALMNRMSLLMSGYLGTLHEPLPVGVMKMLKYKLQHTNNPERQNYIYVKELIDKSSQYLPW